VAARMGITERYLQQLMGSHGETFSPFVQHQRSTRQRPCWCPSATTAFPKSRFSAVSPTSPTSTAASRSGSAKAPRAYRK
jgi:hypothetical protein